MALYVTDEIPHGNVCGVRIEDEADPPVVGFTADPHGAPESLWFCFRVGDEAGEGGGKLRLELDHVDTLLGGGREPTNIRPVLRYAGDDWRRLDAGEVIEDADGCRKVAWTVNAPRTHFDLAVCYPYGMAELTEALGATGDYWTARTIGVSHAGRPLVRLANDFGQADGDRPGVFLVARQHAGETPGSWVLDGLLREMPHHDAPVTWVIPLAHVDGVVDGDYGKDPFPWDVNRAWQRPSMRHENHCYLYDFGRWKKRCRPLAVLDLHAPGLSEGRGAYLHLPDLSAREIGWYLQRWTPHLAEAFGELGREEFVNRVRWVSRTNYYRIERPPTLSSWAAEQITGFSATVEIPYALAGETVLTREIYRDLGARMARALCQPPD